ncbi:MAG: hypothetical protein V4787_11480 [Pseudomonadota bacterium]
MKTNHTPGPWRANRDSDTRGNHTWRIDAPTVSLLAVLTYPNAGARADGMGDALLIAAAPAMLEALKSIAAHATPYASDDRSVMDSGWLIETCRAAIAAATGASS